MKPPPGLVAEAKFRTPIRGGSAVMSDADEGVSDRRCMPSMEETSTMEIFVGSAVVPFEPEVEPKTCPEFFQDDRLQSGAKYWVPSLQVETAALRSMRTLLEGVV
jgi:hypothetical protein